MKRRILDIVLILSAIVAGLSSVVFRPRAEAAPVHPHIAQYTAGQVGDLGSGCNPNASCVATSVTSTGSGTFLYVRTTGAAIAGGVGIATMGARHSSGTGAWWGNVTPTASNYAIDQDSSGNTGLNTVGSLAFSVGNSVKMSMVATAFTPAITTSIDARFTTKVQAITVADSGGAGAAVSTLTPDHSYVSYTCSDADGCDITLSETGAIDGTILRITNVSANACNFADTAGVTELAAAFAMGQYDTLALIYATDRWVEVSRSNN